MKSFKDVIDFANHFPICFVATIDGDKPRVRGLWMWFADESGFYFYTKSSKNIVSQLYKNPNIEVCYYKQGEAFIDSVMLRISGKIRFIHDKNLMKKLQEQKSYLLNNNDRSKGQELLIFKIFVGEAYFWKTSTISDILDEAKILLFDIDKSVNVMPCNNTSTSTSPPLIYLSFNEKEYHYHLDFNNIIYLSSTKKHSIIHTENRDYETAYLLKNITGKLPPEKFIRIQKQYIVNLKYLDRIEYYKGGRYIAYLKDSDDTILPVGRKYVSALKEKMSIHIPFIP
jgi:pyridoxamine 5'-phosphate oxidase